MQAGSHKKFFLSVIAAALIVICYNFLVFQSNNQKIIEYQNDISEIDIEKIFGKNLAEVLPALQNILRGNSDNFYGDETIICLSSNGSSKTFKVYNKLGVEAFYILLSTEIETDYDSKLCKDIKVEVVQGFDDNNEAVLKITPGEMKGYNLIKFHNTSNADKFYILVLVS